MSETPSYKISRPSPGVTQFRLLGSWTVNDRIPETSHILDELGESKGRVVFATDTLEAWDSSMLVFLKRLLALLQERQIEVDLDGLPGGARKLLRLADENKEKEGQEKIGAAGLVLWVGNHTLAGLKLTGEMALFSGELGRECLHFIRGRAYFRRRDLVYFVQDCGANALPIITLVSLLVGVILAFVGAIQLEMFGAQIYVANLVGIAMLLEMGAMITGIIMAGRTGASYAAQLGTMQVNEEIDALTTMGISPLAFLVIPRMLALILMLPLLCIYADLLGIVGGGLIGVGMLDLSVTEYLIQTRKALHIEQFGEGVFKSLVYAVLIGYSGCFYGMRSGRSAAAVGRAATSAVVACIVLIVIADAIMVVLFNIL